MPYTRVPAPPKKNKCNYICPIEIESIEKILQSNEWDDCQKAYFKAKIINRVNELMPLFNECIEKNISLQYLDNDINNEWNSIISIRNKFCV